MNRATMRKDRENQKRLLQELERLSDDSISSEQDNLFAPSSHDTPMFSGTLFFSSSELAGVENHSNQDNQLLMDLRNSSPTSLMYEPEASCGVSETQQLQVDHNGAKVQQLPFSSAWLSSSDFSDMGTSASISTSSSTREKSPSLSPACVAAAATAAMIVVSDDPVVKRPRSPLLDKSAIYEGDDEDNTTEATLEEREDPISPRSVSEFPKVDNLRYLNVDHHRDHVVAHQRPSVPPPPQPLKDVQPQATRRLPLEVEKRMMATLSLDFSANPAASKKRRAEAMERFRRKKAVRCFGRKVRYQIRKRIATTRPRVNGRFARRCDTETKTAKSSEIK